MRLSRKLKLFIGYLKALTGDWATTHRHVAYRYYLSKTFPDTKFDSNCIVGENCSFDQGVSIASNNILNNTQVGRFTSIGYDGVYNNCQIGNFCSLGPRILAGLGRHPVNFVSTSPAFYSPQHTNVRISFVQKQFFEELLSITIGSDVWIGAHTILLDGIRIGHGAIIGAGAVVTKDVEPYTIVGGVPAKLIRKRFSEDIIELLLSTCWWDKSEHWLREYSEHFQDVERFTTVVRDIMFQKSQND